MILADTIIEVTVSFQTLRIPSVIELDLANAYFNLSYHLLFTPYMPHVGPLDLVTCREAALFVFMRSIRPLCGCSANLFLHPLTPHVGPLDPVTTNMCKEVAPLYSVYGTIRLMMEFDFPKS